MVEFLASPAHGWGGGAPFAFLPLLWTALLIGGGVFLWRRRGGKPDGGAEAVLAARYARGDIGDDEYRERLSVLREARS